MAINVAFQNPTTGEIKSVKVGWSWLLLFLSGVFGIPLFMRKLTMWGFVFLAANLFGLACLMAGESRDTAHDHSGSTAGVRSSNFHGGKRQ
jgi:hypothetical protein